MNKELIYAELERITNSPTFTKSEISKQLLIYLTNATLTGETIKEFTIANEVFNKDSDTGVRTYICNLRKKLEEFYGKEGNNTVLIFSIPKGQYYLKFDFRQNNSAISAPIVVAAIQTKKKVCNSLYFNSNSAIYNFYLFYLWWKKS
jgi:hypothetical protein